MQMAAVTVIIVLILTLEASTTTLAARNALAENKTCYGDGTGGSTGISLSFDIYLMTCPQAEDIVRSGVEQAVASDPRMAASLLRLHFHDCFVNGCDGSLLLDDNANFVGEKTAGPNLNSLRGFEVIDSIKSELEEACPQTVSCADILAIAARDSVVLSGGPTWQVETGRTDSRGASLTKANNNLPAPTSNVPTLIQKFQNLGLSAQDMVVLSGAHTIGKARCSSFSSRLNSMGDLEFIQSLQQLCSGSNGTLAHLDLSTPATFDNQYYINLLSGDGLLPSDQVLAGGPSGVLDLVQAYATDQSLFFEDFATSVIRMGRLTSTTGTAGEVRKNCRVVN
ncbi:Peroxidase [Rhynchospora pubera]|uniref:Peroxidase n=2 Tax=Rhynchospora pubera TaxID=906938 RepID=A0AAV8CI15_9POAL|nr:Peroxidase [Rhynchospora pubera]KAJ4815781.1 Peroxidase [Rhynchospora pubera]